MKIFVLNFDVSEAIVRVQSKKQLHITQQDHSTSNAQNWA